MFVPDLSGYIDSLTPVSVQVELLCRLPEPTDEFELTPRSLCVVKENAHRFFDGGCLLIEMIDSDGVCAAAFSVNDEESLYENGVYTIHFMPEQLTALEWNELYTVMISASAEGCERSEPVLAGAFVCDVRKGELTLMLPSALTDIEAGAFENCAACESILPEGMLSIGGRAFAYGSVRCIVIPESVKQIADDAFEGCDDLVIVCPNGSFAAEYAEQHGFDHADEQQ